MPPSMWSLSAQDWWLELGHFFENGGWVLYVLVVLSVLMNGLLIERIFFRVFVYKKRQEKVMSALKKMPDWRFKMSVICDLELMLKENFPLIKTMIASSPLIGLLGTVVGMIQVFDSLALYGTSNPRMMASGVANATLPTMAGMALAVFGLMVYSRLVLWSEKEKLNLLSIKQALKD